MKLNKLASVKNTERKRVGRGIGSGKGKTAGRGTKGQKSRSGGKVRVGFEGGQMPLTQRVPQLRGFKSRRPERQVINLKDIAGFSGKVTKEELLKAGLIENAQRPVKILGKGEIEKAIEITVEAVSKSAEEEIIKKGGRVNKISK